jgi:hypothetical protein
MTNRTYRMYGLVPYNLSPIQQGIQFGHAVVEYSLEFGSTAAYQKWAREDKTFIILNGGTTNLNTPGTLNSHEYQLEANRIQHANFFEPDLGDQLTATVFLVDERVFDRETWPDYSGCYYADMRTPVAEDYYNWKMKFADTEEEADRIVWLRSFLRNFRLA